MKNLFIITAIANLILAACKPEETAHKLPVRPAYIVEKSEDGFYRVFSNLTNRTVEIAYDEKGACAALKFWENPPTAQANGVDPFAREQEFSKTRKWTQQECR